MNMKLKINLTNKLKAVGLMFAMVFGVLSVNAQCNITYQGSPCIGDPITFFCNSPGASNYNWDFNGEGTNVADCNAAFTFTTAGTKTIKLSLKLANGQTCNAQIQVVVKNKPKIKLTRISNKKQCFLGNSFCFIDSTEPGDAGGCLKVSSILFDDGELIRVTGDPNTGGIKMPRTFCKSFKNPAGGTYGVTVEVEDCNGCISKVYFPTIAIVEASLGLSFTSNRPKACDSVVMTVTNNSTIPFDSISVFEWDWGDGTKNTSNWGPIVKHTFRTQGPNQGDFTTKLKVTSKTGCTETYTFNASATNLVIKPIIIATRDSVCVSDAEISFRLKDGPIPQGANPLYTYEDIRGLPANFTRGWQGTHRFGALGPHKIIFSYTHVIPGCSKTVFDTILVIGPQSTIEGSILSGMRFLEDTQRYQCVIKDTVHFYNFSKFYHNDKNMKDDDSLLLVYDSLMILKSNKQPVATGTTFNPSIHEWIYPGFNKPLVHSFTPDAKSVSQKHSNQQRGNSCTIRVWDFDDDFCEKCTTDTKNGVNVDKNCKFSKDTLPSHWYTPWDSIYMTQNSVRPERVMQYNKDSGLCLQKRMWPSSSWSIIRDTIVWYGDNALAKKTKDSIIYKNIRRKQMVRRGMAGPSRLDVTVATRFFIKSGDTIYIDNNNGFPPNIARGQRYQTIQPGQSIIIKSPTDSALYNVWLEYIQDTIASNLVQPWHKVWKTETIQGYQVGDSINPDAHRQKFYSGNTVRCFNVRLFHKDICHALACEHEAIAQLALQPPSAKKLRKEGVQCLGSDQDNYGITFILSDTKPGCSRTFAKINFDTALNKTGWVNLVGANLTPGSVATGNLPPINPPYQVPLPGYQINGPAPTRYSKQFTVDDIKDSITGYINVGLIIGNGIWRDPNAPPDDDLNYPTGCVDTVYYEKFARFPILDNRFRIIKPKEGTEFTKICRRDSISLALLTRNRSYIPDVEEAYWTLDAANVGKFYNQYYRLSVNERYKRFQKVPNDPTYLMDSLIIERSSYFDGVDNRYKTDRIPIAKITKWHTEADITPVFDIIKTILERNNIDVYELSPAQMSEIIWNGQGTFGKPYTGSRGCLDTTGFGRFIRFYQVADEKQILHFRDTSLRPVDMTTGWDGKAYSAYTFAPQYSGYYIANFGLRSRAPENCTKQTGTAKKVIVGYYNTANFTDTILCHGDQVEATPQFRYFEVYPEIFFRLLDPTDYWRNRILEAGNPNREGFTKWDFSKKDDNPAIPRTIFGGAPYSATGLGNPVIRLGGLSTPGSIYYNQDTGDIYLIRVASSDSAGCKDTIEQNVYITAARAQFKLSTNRPQCKTIIEFFDSSYIQDPCINALGGPCDRITKWTIYWGDKSRNDSNIFYNSLPPQIGHDYTRNGRFKIVLKVETSLGCVSYDSTILVIPGPIPFFDTFIPRKYCVDDIVKFSNLSTYNRADSSLWIWSFGDNSYGNQYDTITNLNDTISHKYKKPGKYQIYLTHFFVLKEPGGGTKRCSVVYPDTTEGQQPIFEIEIIAYDTVKLYNDTTVCLNDIVNLRGEIKPAGRYPKYIWNFGKNPLDTVISKDSVKTISYSNKGRYVVRFSGDASSVSSSEKVCAATDSIVVNVSTVKAAFTIDSSKKPVFCFPNTSTDADKYLWSYFNGGGNINSTTLKPIDPSKMKIDNEQKGPGAIDMNHCRDYRDSVGSYWVCMIAIQTLDANSGKECQDTICQKLVNNFKAGIKPPNVFTPDKANTFQGEDPTGLKGNQVFNIYIEGEEKYDLVIFDRWGKKVFESTDKNKDWNGQVNNTGNECPDGVYYYILKYRYKGDDKDEPVLNGIVHIIRN